MPLPKDIKFFYIHPGKGDEPSNVVDDPWTRKGPAELKQRVVGQPPGWYWWSRDKDLNGPFTCPNECWRAAKELTRERAFSK